MSILDSAPIASLLATTASSPAPVSGPTLESAELDKMKVLSQTLSNISDPTIVLKIMAEDAQKKLTRQQEILAILKDLNGSGTS